MNQDYGALEADLLKLLHALREYLTEEEVREVRYFMDANEYGVAFETLCLIIKEEGKPVTASLKAELGQFGRRIDIDPDWALPALAEISDPG